MKMQTVKELIEAGKRSGYMVHFEWYGDGFLRSDHFPDKHKGEELIRSEEEAWQYAEKFANALKGKVCNLYVTDSDFIPVMGYEKREISNR